MANSKTVEIYQQVTEEESRRCSYCGVEAPLVWVHGHGQCAHCGINVQECCQGENCEMN
ncbi:hypothetical protein [Fodinibius saliphilus]|uniref:hypothetical protein n=1 Tax=Fodinibius saliphilus TaxID=1920650 RepID=UPI001486B1E1|nr:hypothetical protein [Fodinibius saliphilus]